MSEHRCVFSRRTRCAKVSNQFQHATDDFNRLMENGSVYGHAGCTARIDDGEVIAVEVTRDGDIYVFYEPKESA